jgi:hypothetical protein
MRATVEKYLSSAWRYWFRLCFFLIAHGKNRCGPIANGISGLMKKPRWEIVTRNFPSQWGARVEPSTIELDLIVNGLESKTAPFDR